MAFKRMNFFFSPADEQAFSSRLSDAYPDIRFRDGDRWRVGANPFRASIDQCESLAAYLWEPGLFPTVPTRETGEWVEGAKTRQVIQFTRSAEVNNALRIGQMAASYDPGSSPEKQFVQRVFRILKSFGARKIQAIEVSSGRALGPPTGAIVVGPSCAALVESGAVLSAPVGVRWELA